MVISLKCVLVYYTFVPSFNFFLISNTIAKSSNFAESTSKCIYNSFSNYSFNEQCELSNYVTQTDNNYFRKKVQKINFDPVTSSKLDLFTISLLNENSVKIFLTLSLSLSFCLHVYTYICKNQGGRKLPVA